jgi:hypothetical protein
VTGQCVGAKFRLPGGLGRFVDPAVLRAVELPARAKVGIAVEALIHLVDPGLDTGIGGGVGRTFSRSAQTASGWALCPTSPARRALGSPHMPLFMKPQ